MKKVISLLVVAMVLLSLSACSNSNTNSDVTSVDSQIISTETEQNEPVESIKPATSTHTHDYSSATCTAPAKCSCGATNGSELGHSYSDATCTDAKKCSRCGATSGNALGHSYNNGVCTRCNEKDPNYKPTIEKIQLNTAVTVSSNHEYRLGDLKITVLGFEKTSWKADEYKYNADDPDDMAPEYKALGETEEIGMLKLVVNKISYDDPENADMIHFEDVLKIYDEYGIALTAMNRGWNYGSYEVALGESVRMKKGETTRVAIPYIYDTSNKSLRVILGEKYEVTVPVVQ